MVVYLPNSILKALRLEDFETAADEQQLAFNPAPPEPEPTPAPEPPRPAFQLPSWESIQLGAGQAAGQVADSLKQVGETITGAVNQVGASAQQAAAPAFKLPEWESFKLPGGTDEQSVQNASQPGTAAPIPAFEDVASPAVRGTLGPGRSSPGPSAGAGAVPSPQAPAVEAGDEVGQAALTAGVDPALFRRLVGQESGGSQAAVSPAGALGAAQLMPGTAAYLAKKYNLDTTTRLGNLTAGAWYLKEQLDEFGSVPAALAAYNAGPGAVQKHGGVPPFAETQGFVEKVGGGYTGNGRAQASAASPQPSGPQANAASKTGPYDIAFGYDQPYGGAQFNENIPRHRGVDLVVRGAENNGRGSPVGAFRGGTVVALTQDPNGGSGVILQNEDGLYDRYFHFDAVNVKQGQRVAPGDTLGALGASGTEGFPHVHFEVSKGLNGDPVGQTIDPRPYMAGGAAHVDGDGHTDGEPPPLPMASGDETPSSSRGMAAKPMTVAPGPGAPTITVVEPTKVEPKTGLLSIPDKGVGLPEVQAFEPGPRGARGGTISDSERGPFDPPGYEQDSTYGPLDPPGYGGPQPPERDDYARARPVYGPEEPPLLGPPEPPLYGPEEPPLYGPPEPEDRRGLPGQIADAAQGIARGGLNTALRGLVSDTGAAIDTKVAEADTERAERQRMAADLEASDLPEAAKIAMRSMDTISSVANYLSALATSAAYEGIRDTVIKPILAKYGLEHHVNLPIVGEIGTADLVANYVPGLNVLGGASKAGRVLRNVPRTGLFSSEMLDPSETVIGRPIVAAGQAIANTPVGQAVGRGVGFARDLIDYSTGERRGAPASRLTPEEVDAIQTEIRDMPTGAPVGRVVPESDRYYHGTGSAFDTPDPATFDENGLFGPGYYLTSDPRVAGGYSGAETTSARATGSQRTLDHLLEQKRVIEGDLAARDFPYPDSERRARANLAATERHIARIHEEVGGFPSPNVRAVDVPRGLRLLDAEAPAPRGVLPTIQKSLEPSEARALTDYLGLLRRNANGAPTTLGNVLEAVGQVSQGGGAGRVNKILAAAGYDGISYSGGKRIPMKDDAGQPIEHNVVAIFPESLPKITNATSGLSMGLNAIPAGGYVARAGTGAAAGAGSMYIDPPTDENGERLKPSDPRYQEELWRRMVIGAGAGLATKLVRGASVPAEGGIAQAVSPPQAAVRQGREYLSPVGREVADAYAQRTPDRVMAARERAVQIATDQIVGASRRAPVGVGELLSQTFDALVQTMPDTKVVATGLRKDAIEALLQGKGITTKADAQALKGDTSAADRVVKITQQQVNVKGGREKMNPDTGQLERIPYTYEDAQGFVQREGLQNRMVLGGSRFPIEGQPLDADAPRHAYAYVTEGQPLIGPNSPDIWMTWKRDTSRVTSAHHPYALGSPYQDIHAKMPSGLKQALWAERSVEGAKVVVGPNGQPIVEGWESGGVKLPGGRMIAETTWLVDQTGEDAMRAAGLMMSIPAEVRAQVARGEITDPAQLAAVLQRGGQVRSKDYAGAGAVQNLTRSEALIVDPSLQNVEALYISGPPKILERNVPKAGKAAGVGKGGLSVVDSAMAIRDQIKKETGQDVPVLYLDTSKGPPLISNARTLAGPDTTLAPGRGGVVERYTQATDPATGQPYTNIGVVAREGGAPVAGRLASQAVSGAVMGGWDASQEEGATPGSVLGGMASGAAGSMIQGSLGRRGGQQALRAGIRAADLSDPDNKKLGEMFAKPISPPKSTLPWSQWLAQGATDDRATVYAWQKDLQNRLPAGAGPTELIGDLTRRNPDSTAAVRLERLKETTTTLRAAGVEEDVLGIFLAHVHDVDIANDFGQRAYDRAIQKGASPADAQLAFDRVADRRTFSGGRHRPDIVQSLQSLANDLTPEQRQALLDAAGKVWKLNQETLERKYLAGGLSQAQYQDLVTRYPHYVTTDVVDHIDPDSAVPVAGRSISQREKPLNRLSASGTAADRLDPLRSVVANTIRSERWIARNEPARLFADLAKSDPQGAANLGVNPSKMEGTKELVWYDNGDRKTIRVSHALAEVITMGHGPGGSAGLGMLGSILSKLTGPYKAGLTTLNAGFQLVTNPLRDGPDAIISMMGERGGPQHLGEVLKAYGSAVADVIQNGPYTQAYKMAGGSYEKLDTSAKGIERYTKELTASKGELLKDPRQIAKIVRDVLTLGAVPAGQKIEMFPRIAAFKLATEKGLPRDVTTTTTSAAGNTVSVTRPGLVPATPTQAMIAGHNVTVPFEVAGTWARGLNTAIPFLNATVQNAARFAREMKAHPIGASASAATLLGVPALAAYAMNHRDDATEAAYEDVPQYLKDSGMVFMLPWAGQDNRGPLPNYLWLPGGRYQPFKVLMDESISRVMGDASPREIWQTIGSVLTAYSPIKGESLGAAASSVVPPGISTTIELGQNKDFFRGRAIATDEADLRAGSLARGISGAANALGNSGLPFTGGLRDVRPSQTEYIIRDLFGAPGQTASAAADIVTGRDDGRTRPVQDVPVLGGLAGRVVRDTGGQKMEEAREARISPDVSTALRDAGLRPEDVVSPVGLTAQGVPLDREQQLAYQTFMNGYLERQIALAQRSAEYRNPMTREQAIRDAVSTARTAAGERVLSRIPSVQQEMLKRQETVRKAG